MTREEAFKIAYAIDDGTSDMDAVTLVRQVIESFQSEHMGTTNNNGHLDDFPQLGRFKPNTKIELFSREMK